MNNNVRLLPGVSEPDPVAPDPELVEHLERLLADARAGELRCFVGCGICRDGETVDSLWAGELNRARFTLLGGLTRVTLMLQRKLFPDEWPRA